MRFEKYQWLAAVVAAHPNMRIVGRTRLQKTIRLLQRLGLPTDYEYVTHFYGPYSEGVQADVNLLEKMQILSEQPAQAMDGSIYYTISVNSISGLPQLREFKQHVDTMA